MSIYKDCDIRGVFPAELQTAEVKKIGRALATISPGEFLVGGDVRLSTPELKSALIEGLAASGAAVTDLGTIPTPALYFALKHLSAAAGATVTASHNPPEYNGVKFMIGDMPVTRGTIDRVREIVETGEFAEAQGTVVSRDILPEYIGFMAGRFRAEAPLRVLIDAGNGAMSGVAPEVFRRAGYSVTELDCAIDGRFPNRSPNPSDFRNLTRTCEAVRAANVDFGVAFDGDGDRAVFIDAQGTPVQIEKAMVLFIRHALRDAPASVVYDQKSSSVVKKTILSLGGTPLPERSGHAFIKRRFLENGSALGCEVSGHYFFRELGYDDGLFAALTMAEILTAAGKALSALTDEIVCPPVTPDIRVPCAYALHEACLARAEKAALEHGAEISRLDGVRAEFPDGWFLIRRSVTAEQLTLRAEAETQARLEELLELLRSVLPEEIRPLVTL